MALTLGHAIRRRVGIAPNPQVMAESGQPEGRPDTIGCHVGGCGARLPAQIGGITPTEHRQRVDDYYQHFLVDHPRHPSAGAARDYFRDRERQNRFVRGY